MNVNDRRLIGNLIDAIASDDRNSQVNAAKKLMQLHPKIKEDMEHVDWWGEEPLRENNEI